MEPIIEETILRKIIKQLKDPTTGYYTTIEVKIVQVDTTTFEEIDDEFIPTTETIMEGRYFFKVDYTDNDRDVTNIKLSNDINIVDIYTIISADNIIDIIADLYKTTITNNERLSFIANTDIIELENGSTEVKAYFVGSDASLYKTIITNLKPVQQESIISSIYNALGAHREFDTLTISMVTLDMMLSEIAESYNNVDDSLREDFKKIIQLPKVGNIIFSLDGIFVLSLDIETDAYYMQPDLINTEGRTMILPVRRKGSNINNDINVLYSDPIYIDGKSNKYNINVIGRRDSSSIYYKGKEGWL